MQARPIFIEYRRRRGFQLEYQVVRSTEREIVKSGNPLMRLVGKKQSSKVVGNARVEMMMVQRTADVSPDWVASVKSTIESAARTVGGEPAPFGRDDDPCHTYLNERVDRFGNVLEVSGSAPRFLTGVFPDRSLRPGETWDVNEEVIIPKFNASGRPDGQEKVDLPYLYTLVGQQKVDNYQCAEVKVVAKHQSYVNETTIHQYLIEGTLLFAYRDGFLVHSHVNTISRLGTQKSTTEDRIIDEMRLLREGNEDTIGGMRL